MAKKQYAIARTVDFNTQFILDEVVAIFGYNVRSDGLDFPMENGDL